jgi:homoserine kinase type II
VAAYTRIGVDDAEAIARAYSLVGVTAVEPVRGGTVNSNYYVSAGGADLFLRVYEEAGPTGARFEALFASHLAARGIPTPVPLRTRAGGFFAEHAGKPVALFPRVGGFEVCQALVTPARARRVGRAVAQIHAAARDFPDRRTGRFTLGDVVHRLDGVREPRLAVTVDRLRREVDRLERVRERLLPMGPVHGDLFRDNVRWDGDEIVAVLDFESASVGSYAYDLAVVLLSWCFSDRFVPELVAAAIEGYESVRPLEPVERAALSTEARVACVRFATTRITDVELRTPPGGRPRKDYRRFLARLDAVDAALGR